MSVVVIDDHLLGDVVGGMVPTALATLVRQNVIATTNLYYYRLCRAALVARGGALTGSWSPERREQAARALVALSPEIEVLPIRALAFRIAELARDHQLSTLGAEAVAAAEARDGSLFVWEGDDGTNIRACCEAVGVAYRTVARE
jgi:hypothetical protein